MCNKAPCVLCIWAQSLSCVQLSVTCWTEAHQAPLSMGLSKQEYWSGLPLPPPGDLPDVSFTSCTGRQILYPWVTWEAHVHLTFNYVISRLNLISFVFPPILPLVLFWGKLRHIVSFINILVLIYISKR